MRILFIIAVMLQVFPAACALDTTGTLFGPAADVIQEDSGNDSGEDHYDLPPDGVDGLDREEGASCIPGQFCDGGGYCCCQGGLLGCYESAEGCDCSESAEICTGQDLYCCEVDYGSRLCRTDTAGCYCSGPEDTWTCAAGQICCAQNTTGPYFCSVDSEGCFCIPGTPEAAEFCGSERICCNKGDHYRCYADTSNCECSVEGANTAECGPFTSLCCERGGGDLRCVGSPEGCGCATSAAICEGLVCCEREGRWQCVGDPEGCVCNDHVYCGDGYVCCDRVAFIDADDVKECHRSGCYCICSHMPAGNCGVLGEDLWCLLDNYCGNPLVCW